MGSRSTFRPHSPGAMGGRPRLGGAELWLGPLASGGCGVGKPAPQKLAAGREAPLGVISRRSQGAEKSL